jgi:hypothetical protein
MQAKESARRRLNKRPRADTLPSSAFSDDFAAKNTNSPRKKIQKTLQLPQFRVYEIQTFSAIKVKNSGQNELIPSLIKCQINKIWLYISVEIPFRPEFHSISVELTPKGGPRKPLASLLLIAINGAKKAPETL